jgi:hypothetical protein
MHSKSFRVATLAAILLSMPAVALAQNNATTAPTRRLIPPLLGRGTIEVSIGLAWPARSNWPCRIDEKESSGGADDNRSDGNEPRVGRACGRALHALLKANGS